MALGIRQRLLISHVFAVISVAGTFGAVVYWVAAEQVARAGDLYSLRLYAALAFCVCVLAALVLSRHLALRFLARITDLTARCRALASGEPVTVACTQEQRLFSELAEQTEGAAAGVPINARRR